MQAVSRRDLIKGIFTLPAAGWLSDSFAGSSQPTKPVKLADVGWSWEGQGFVGGAGVSLYRAGGGGGSFRAEKDIHRFLAYAEVGGEKARFLTERVTRNH